MVDRRPSKIVLLPLPFSPDKSRPSCLCSAEPGGIQRSRSHQVQSRAAVRAELKQSDCNIWVVPDLWIGPAT